MNSRKSRTFLLVAITYILNYSNILVCATTTAKEHQEDEKKGILTDSKTALHDETFSESSAYSQLVFQIPRITKNPCLNPKILGYKQLKPDNDCKMIASVLPSEQSILYVENNDLLVGRALVVLDVQEKQASGNYIHIDSIDGKTRACKKCLVILNNPLGSISQSKKVILNFYNHLYLKIHVGYRNQKKDWPILMRAYTISLIPLHTNNGGLLGFVLDMPVSLSNVKSVIENLNFHAVKSLQLMHYDRMALYKDDINAELSRNKKRNALLKSALSSPETLFVAKTNDGRLEVCPIDLFAGMEVLRYSGYGALLLNFKTSRSSIDKPECPCTIL